MTLVTYQNFPVSKNFEVTDPDTEILQYEWIKKPEFGVIKKEKGWFVYRPGRNFIGQDYFRYRAFDGQDYSAEAEVEIEVQPIQGTDGLSQLLQQTVQKGGVAVGNLNSNDFLFQQGLQVPASILKLVTALAAIHYLGKDARFQTEFFQDTERNLYIKGYGDPSLTTAEWQKIAAELSKMGLFEKPIHRIVLDDTAIEEGIDFDGRRKTINYFDAPLGALASNYNMIAVNKKSKNQIIPWKSQTPITAIIRSRARGLPNGYQQFSVAINAENGTLYTGELIGEIFMRFGAKNRPVVQRGSVPLSSVPFYIHNSSQNMEDVIRLMFHESSNFIANQLLLVMALDKFGEQARMAQGVDLLKGFMRKQIGMKETDFVILEGSGLSHKNRVDLKSMLEVVTRFENQRDLLPNLTESKYFDLIEIGRRWSIRAKTGTMNGVSALAGFLQKKDKQWLPFVIMLEGLPADRAQVLEIICRYFAG
ncbi:MAG: D-alanyl-D-alanine carboxypeptidase [SAR324 cluster bacterium]|nr:D-alanyl-D-alanine carboxypeptidase [SAR324 cluster bacterium]